MLMKFNSVSVIYSYRELRLTQGIVAIGIDKAIEWHLAEWTHKVFRRMTCQPTYFATRGKVGHISLKLTVSYFTLFVAMHSKLGPCAGMSAVMC